MRIVRLFLCCLIVVLTACQSRPDCVIDEPTMIDLLTDIHLAEGLLDLQQKENSQNEQYGQQVIAAVLDKYHVSKADYDTSLVWYSQHLTKLIRVYRHVDENLNEQRDYWESVLAESGAGIGVSGDSVNLWRETDYLVMDESRLSHYRIWMFQTDTTFHQGDMVRWTLHVPDMPEGQALAASLVMVYAETDHVIIGENLGQTTSLISNDSIVTLTCTGGKGQDISQIIATLHLQHTDSASVPLLPCVVDGFQLTRLHPKE